MPILDRGAAIDLELLRAWWCLLTILAAGGLAWTVLVWWRIASIRKRRMAPPWNVPELRALTARRRDAMYRIWIKVALFGYAIGRWGILTSSEPAVQDARQFVDATFYTVVLLLLTAWSVQQWWTIWRTRGG